MIEAISLKKIKIIEIISVIALVVVGTKLSYETIIKNKALSDKAQDLWERSFPLVAPRGLILDRNNNKVAINNPTYSIAVIPFQIKDKDGVASKLAEALNTSKGKILEKISKKASIVRLHPEGRRISID